jgi:hypothetical protein
MNAAALEAICPLIELGHRHVVAHIAGHANSAAIANRLGSAA